MKNHEGAMDFPTNGPAVIPKDRQGSSTDHLRTAERSSSQSSRSRAVPWVPQAA